MSTVAASTPAAAGFDYSEIDAQVADEARAAVERFRRRSETYFMDTGRDLIAMKGRLEHGVFLDWVGTEMGLTPRTAQNFMQVAGRLGDKSEIVSHLPPTILYRLAAPSTPDATREQVLALAESGRIDAKVVEQLVADGRASVKEAARKTKLSPDDAKAKRKRAQRDKSRERQRLNDLKERAEAGAIGEQKAAESTRQAAIFLVKKLGDDLKEFLEILKTGNWFWMEPHIRKATQLADKTEHEPG